MYFRFLTHSGFFWGVGTFHFIFTLSHCRVYWIENLGGSINFTLLGVTTRKTWPADFQTCQSTKPVVQNPCQETSNMPIWLMGAGQFGEQSWRGGGWEIQDLMSISSLGKVKWWLVYSSIFKKPSFPKPTPQMLSSNRVNFFKKKSSLYIYRGLPIYLQILQIKQ